MKEIISFIFINIYFFFIISLFCQPYQEIGYTQEGKASFYGKKFHGKTTASGEKFDMYAMTAAHKYIPFHSLIKVTDIKNNKWIVVRVNDRGPFIKGRIVDLSKKAAEKLGMINRGVISVKLELLRVGPIKNFKKLTPNGHTNHTENKKHKKISEKKVTFNHLKKSGMYDLEGIRQTPKNYSIQVAAYTNINKIKGYVKNILQKGLKEVYIQVLRERNIYRVMIGNMSTKEEARILLKKVKHKGFRDAFIKKNN